MIAYLLLILLVAILAFALFEASREAGFIADKMGGVDLEHEPLVWRRISVLLIPIILACWKDGAEGWAGMGMLACYSAASWSGFVIVHRFRLNTLRKMDWRFVANSSWFDRQCMNVCGVVQPDTKAFNKMYHQQYKTIWTGYVHPTFRANVHRAGLLSYIAIALVLAASIVGVVAILNH